MAPNQIYEILAQDMSGEWLLVCCLVANQSGWVDKETVNITGNEEHLLDLIPPVPQIEIGVARLNARTEPSAESDVAAILLQGEHYDLINQDNTGDWYRICCVNDVEVWVFADSVTVWGDLRNVPVYQE